MDENNPLRLSHSKRDSTELNRSGRPTNENIIRFGPQPKSFVSKMFEKIQENVDLSIDLNVFNNTTGAECIAVEKCYVPESSNQHIALDPVVDTVKVKNTIAEGRKFACDFPNCNYACKLSSNLIKHKRTHTSEKPYLCHLCSFRSNFINSLKVHQRIHTAERPYACNHCVYRCNSSSNLKKHCKHRHSTAKIKADRLC